MSKPATSIESRFWPKVLVGKPNECWNWIGAITVWGYGELYLKQKENPKTKNSRNKVGRAPRISWEIHNGPIPERMWVLHKCDNRACVNPNHLFLGTREDNDADREWKGRTARGNQLPQTKLTEKDLRTIRDLYQSGVRQAEIGRRFSVAQGHISRIVNYRRNFKRRVA